MTNNQLKIKCVKLVEEILYATRNENWKAEQTAVTKFNNFCEKYNINSKDAMDGAIQELNQSVSAIMNGLV